MSDAEMDNAVSWDLDRLAVPQGDVHASDDALAVLGTLDSQASVERVCAYASDGGPDNVATDHLLRVLGLVDGQLALVTWDSFGITAIGYRPTEQRYDVGQFSGVDKRMGNEYQTYERATRSEVKDTLSWTTPTIVCRDESKQLPDLDAGEVAP